MARPRPLPKNALLLGGAAVVGYFALRGRASPYKKGSPQQNAIDAGTATYDANFFKNPPEDYALMPAAARALLIKQNGPDGFVNGKPMPQTKLSDMDRQVSFWKKLATSADLAENFRKRLAAVKLPLLTRTSREKGVFPPTALNVSEKPFVAYGDGLATEDEIRKFWYEIDKVAIAVHARTSWNPAAYANLATEMKLSANELVKKGAKAARGLFDAVFDALGGTGILLTAAAVGGGYLYFTRRR